LALIKLSAARYYLAGFSTPLVFNKHTYEMLRLRVAFDSRVRFKLDLRTKNSRVTTLRAPKHFKVGRHHYQIERNYLAITFYPRLAVDSRISTYGVPCFVSQVSKLLGTRYTFRVFSLVSSYQTKFTVRKTFSVI